MKKRTKKLLVTSLLTAITCLFGTALIPKTVTAEEQFAESSYSFVDNVSKTTYDGVHYSAFDALSVNFPTTSANGTVNVKFPFAGAEDLTATNGAVRIRIQTAVTVTGRESIRFQLIGAASTAMSAGKTVYLEENDSVTAATVESNGSVYVVQANKLFNGYLTIPVSTWNVTATDITALNMYTNPLFTKTIWNFGDIEFGTVDANGAFTASKTLWTAFDAQGNANAYTADSTVDAALLKANTIEGTAKDFYLKTKLNDAAENNAAYSTSDYDGIKVHVDNTGSKARSMQFYVWDSATANLGGTSYAWISKNGLAYFMPDEDCAAFENSSAYRSSFVPAGFKGEMYVPFTVNSESEAGVYQPFNANTLAGATFPTAICNQVYVYTTTTEASFGIGAPSLVKDGDAWMAEAFQTTSSVNLGAIDDTKALMIQQANTSTSRFELWPTGTGGGTPSVKLSTVDTSNEVITGGTALAVALENLNGEAFKLKITAYCKNSSGDRIELGGAMAQAKVVFTNVDGSTQLLDIQNGYVTIPAYAKGTLTLSYVGGKASTLVYLHYPTDNLYRIWFDALKVTGDKVSPAYLLGNIAVVNGDGTHTVMTVNGKGISELALNSADGALKKNRANIAYSGTLKYSTASYVETDGATIAVDKASVRYNGEVTYTVNTLAGVASATFNGVDVTDKLVENEGVYTYTTRIKEDSTFAVKLAINSETFYYEGASIRLTGNEAGDGIRFSMLIKKEIYEELTKNNADVVFGTLIIPEDMRGEELTKDTPYVNNTTANNILTEVTKEDGEYVRWIVYLYGIPEASRSRGFCARGYIQIGETYFYTEEKEARSISWVAQQTYAAEETSAEMKALCEKYLPKITFDLGGAEGAIESVTLYDGVTYVLPTAEALGVTVPTGKTLVGYSVYGKTYSVGDKVIINGNVTVILVWEEN